MPRGDNTGPDGEGPRTGRGLGYCSGYDAPGYYHGRGYGRGMGFGRGMGRGYGRGMGYGRYGGGPRGIAVVDRDYPPENNYPAPDSRDERSYLEDVIGSLEREIDAVKKRLSDLGSKKSD